MPAPRFELGCSFEPQILSLLRIPIPPGGQDLTANYWALPDLNRDVFGYEPRVLKPIELSALI
jgi:hypothetical protein